MLAAQRGRAPSSSEREEELTARSGPVGGGNYCPEYSSSPLGLCKKGFYFYCPNQATGPPCDKGSGAPAFPGVTPRWAPP